MKRDLEKRPTYSTSHLSAVRMVSDSSKESYIYEKRTIKQKPTLSISHLSAARVVLDLLAAKAGTTAAVKQHIHDRKLDLYT